MFYRDSFKLSVRVHLYVILTVCTKPFSPALKIKGKDLFMPRKLLVGIANNYKLDW